MSDEVDHTIGSRRGAASDLGERVRARIDRWVADSVEDGIQVAVVTRGQLVVDAVAGTDPSTGDPVRRISLFHAFSTAKGIASTVAHTLIDRGALDPDMALAQVWPAFAVHGKGAVTVRHVLMHTAGVPAPPYDTTVDEVCDWDRISARIAGEMPWWDPGTRFGYHAFTFGFLLGETIRLATGRGLTHWLHELITEPLGIADEVHFGVPARLLHRVVPQITAAGFVPSEPPTGSNADRAVPPAIRPDADYANRRDVLASDIPSGGTMTARGAALVYAALLGDIDGIDLVSHQRLVDLAAVAFRGRDEVMDLDVEWASGFAPGRPSGLPSRTGSTFGMVGANGSAAYADIDTGTTFAVMRNRYDGPNLRAVTEIDRLVHDATT